MKKKNVYLNEDFKELKKAWKNLEAAWAHLDNVHNIKETREITKKVNQCRKEVFDFIDENKFLR